MHRSSLAESSKKSKDPFRKAPFHTQNHLQAKNKCKPSFASTNLLLFSNISTDNNCKIQPSTFSAFQPYKKPPDPFISAPFEQPTHSNVVPTSKSQASTSSSVKSNLEYPPASNPFIDAPFLNKKSKNSNSFEAKKLLNSSTKSDITYQRIDLLNSSTADLDQSVLTSKKYKSLSDNVSQWDKPATNRSHTAKNANFVNLLDDTELSEAVSQFSKKSLAAASSTAAKKLIEIEQNDSNSLKKEGISNMSFNDF